MKKYLLFIVFLAFTITGKSQQPQVPLFRPMFNHFEFTLSYSNCVKNTKSLEYLGNDTYFDGGSEEYFFRTTGTNRVSIFFPNPNSWGRELYRSGLQPVLLSTNSAFVNCYLLKHGSPEEQHLLSLLRSAKSVDRTEGVNTNLPSVSAMISMIEKRTPSGNIYTNWVPCGFVTGSYLNGLRHGTWICWDGNSNKTEETEFQNGLKHGRQISWQRYGKTVEKYEANYCSNVLHGKYTVYLNNAIKEDKWYNQGKIDGISVSYYENGRVKNIDKYSNGEADGLDITFHENGRMKSFREYTNGVWIGSYVSWHSNGQTDTVIQVVKEPNEYQIVSWHSNGIMSEIGHETGNDKTGMWTTWNPDGEINSKGEYIHDQKSGKWFQRSDSRRSIEKGTYNHGRKEGLWQYCDSNGVMTVEVTYTNGIPVSSPVNDIAVRCEYASKVQACMLQLSNELVHAVYTNKEINGVFEYFQVKQIARGESVLRFGTVKSNETVEVVYQMQKNNEENPSLMRQEIHTDLWNYEKDNWPEINSADACPTPVMHNAAKFSVKYWFAHRQKYIAGNWDSFQRENVPEYVMIIFEGFPQDMREICRDIENLKDFPGKYVYTITVPVRR